MKTYLIVLALWALAMPALASEQPDPEQLFTTNGCIGCHTIDGRGGDVGANLSDIGARHDQAFIRTSILKPNAYVEKGFPRSVMPSIFGKTLSDTELDTLVDWLARHQGQ